MLREDDEALYAMGVNLVSISAEYLLNEDGTYYPWFDESLYIENIELAKELGFAVLVAPNFVNSGNMNFSEMGIDITYERYIGVSTELAVQWAEIAEAYAVEYFAPQNEFDNIIRHNFLEDFGDEEGLSHIVTQWHQDVLPQLKAVYSGRIMAKLANVREADLFEGYDLVGETIVHFGMHPRDFRGHVRELYATSASVAEASGAEWVVGEFWMPYDEQWWPMDYVSAGVDLDAMQDDYYRIAAEEYVAFEGYGPSGFIFISYALDGMDIRGRPAEAILSGLFSGTYEVADPLTGISPPLADYVATSMPEGFLIAANGYNPLKNTQVFETGWMHWDYAAKHGATDQQLYDENFAWLAALRDQDPELYVTLRYVATLDGDVPSEFRQYLKDETYTLERFLRMAVENGLYFDMCEFGDEFNLSSVLRLGFTRDEALEYYDACLRLMHQYMPEAIICADVINFLNLRVHPDHPTWHEQTDQVYDDVTFIGLLQERGTPFTAVGTEIQPGAHTYYDTDYIIAYLEAYRQMGLDVYVWEFWMLTEPLESPSTAEAEIYGNHAPPGGYSEAWQAETLAVLLDYFSAAGHVIGFNYMHMTDGEFTGSEPYMNGLIRQDGTYKEGFFVLLDWVRGI
jgi:hypothetical protein